MRKRLITFVIVASAGAAVASITLAGRNSPSAGRSAFSRLSNAQRDPVTLPVADVRTSRLRGSGFTQVWRIATHGNTNFLEFDTTTGRHCYGTGQPRAAWPIDVVMCGDRAPFFPSLERPILDLSVATFEKGDSVVHFAKVDGFAADGITRVALLNARGVTIGQVPVTGNTYSASTLPVEPVTAIAALDSAGNVVPRH